MIQACQNVLAPPIGISRGTSVEAEYVAKTKQESQDRLRESLSFGFGLSRPFDELYKVAEECSIDGWDGESAKPVSTGTFLQAIRFLRSLPFDIKAPSVGADPDGELTFEWYKSPSRVLSVSVGLESVLRYAALIGPRTAYGSEPFLEAPPQVIVDLIREITFS